MSCIFRTVVAFFKRRSCFCSRYVTGLKQVQDDMSLKLAMAEKEKAAKEVDSHCDSRLVFV